MASSGSSTCCRSRSCSARWRSPPTVGVRPALVADLRGLVASDVAEVVRIFQASRAAAMPWLPVIHSTTEDLAYFGSQIDAGTGWGSFRDKRLVGIAFWSEGWLNHLYVDPAERGRGHGSALLSQALADQASGDQTLGLQLWAFARNTPAIGFYRSRGFVVVRETDGRDNEEREPDVLMEFVAPDPV